jgi:hypothetical protein
MRPIDDNRTIWSSSADLRAELLRAEMAGELSEFHALGFQAVLAMAEGNACVDDYLEMAEAVAVEEYELAIVAGIRATRDRVQHFVVPGHSQAFGEQAAVLWQSLLIALANLAPQLAEIRRGK